MTSAGPGWCGCGSAALAMPPGSGERVFPAEQVFPARPEQVGAARRFVARLLAGTPVADDAVLCVSELAGNCVSHSVSGCPGVSSPSGWSGTTATMSGWKWPTRAVRGGRRLRTGGCTAWRSCAG